MPADSLPTSPHLHAGHIHFAICYQMPAQGSSHHHAGKGLNTQDKPNKHCQVINLEQQTQIRMFKLMINTLSLGTASAPWKSGRVTEIVEPEHLPSVRVDTSFRKTGINNSILPYSYRSQGRKPTSNGQKPRQNENLNNGLYNWNQQNWLQRWKSFIGFQKNLYGQHDIFDVTDKKGDGDESNSTNDASREEPGVLIKPLAGHTGDEWPEVVHFIDSLTLAVSDQLGHRQG